MALKPKTLKKLDVAMRQFVAFLKYRAVGPHALSNKELKDLVRAGLITSSQAPRTAVARAYLKTHEQVVADEAAPKSTREGAIDFLERQFSRYADKAGEAFTNDIISQIESQIMPFTDRTEGKHIYELIRDKDIHKKYLGHALNESVKNWTQRWRTIVNTELSRASQFGAMDAILHNNKGKAPEEIVVYKIGPHDGATCKYCMKFWFMDDGVTPRVYRMSELIANGTNIGKKVAQWKPTVDNTHPNERHKLVELQPGFGFVGGRMMFRSKDHDEYGHQRGQS